MAFSVTSGPEKNLFSYPLGLYTHLYDSVTKLTRHSFEDRVSRSKPRLQRLDTIEHPLNLRTIRLLELFNIAVQVLYRFTRFDVDIFGSLQFLIELGENRSDIFRLHQIALSILQGL